MNSASIFYMKKIIVIISFLILSNHLYSQKNIYQFDIGINSIDPFNSSVIKIDYSHSIGKNRWNLGGVIQYANSNFYQEIDYNAKVVHCYYRGKTFTFDNLLINHEKEAGTMKLKSVLHYEQDIFFGPYVSKLWQKSNFNYGFALGIGGDSLYIKRTRFLSKRYFKHGHNQNRCIYYTLYS